jgi:hypothetical protein
LPPQHASHSTASAISSSTPPPAGPSVGTSSPAVHVVLRMRLQGARPRAPKSKFRSQPRKIRPSTGFVVGPANVSSWARNIFKGAWTSLNNSPRVDSLFLSFLSGLKNASEERALHPKCHWRGVSLSLLRKLGFKRHGRVECATELSLLACSPWAKYLRKTPSLLHHTAIPAT